MTIAQVGLKRALWPLLLAMHVPNVAYVALAWWQPPFAAAALLKIDPAFGQRQ